MIVLAAVIVGLLLGSFLSVLLDRWPQWRGAGMGRSNCPHCKHPLAWYDLIPLISWAVLRGRCRYCGKPISKLYPILELSMAAVFGLYAYLYGLPSLWYGVDYLILFAFVSLFFFDLQSRVLPDVIVLPLTVLVGARLVTDRPDQLINAGVTGAVLSGLLLILYLVSRGRWMGLGDVKLAFVIGLLFGYPYAVGLTLIAIYAGALVGIGLMVTHRANRKTALPFGSFWVAAAILTMLLPGQIAYFSGLFAPFLR